MLVDHRKDTEIVRALSRGVSSPVNTRVVTQVKQTFDLASVLVLRGWTQAMYRSGSGIRAGTKDRNWCWCAVGALQEAQHLLGLRALIVLPAQAWHLYTRVKYGMAAILWNDSLSFDDESRRQVASELRVAGRLYVEAHSKRL